MYPATSGLLIVLSATEQCAPPKPQAPGPSLPLPAARAYHVQYSKWMQSWHRKAPLAWLPAASHVPGATRPPDMRSTEADYRTAKSHSGWHDCVLPGPRPALQAAGRQARPWHVARAANPTACGTTGSVIMQGRDTQHRNGSLRGFKMDQIAALTCPSLSSCLLPPRPRRRPLCCTYLQSHQPWRPQLPVSRPRPPVRPRFVGHHV